MPGDKTRGLYRQGRRAAGWGVLTSLGLGTVKLVGGLLGHSVALVSDAVHSFGDALTSSAILGALYWAQQPPDREHPYGHSRIEAVVGSNVALLLVLSALGLIWESLRTLDELSPPPQGYTLAIAAASMVLKGGLYLYSRRVAAHTGSTAVRAASWDHLLDALGSLIVLVGVGLAKWCGPAWHAADHLAAVAVALLMIWAGVSLGYDSLHELLDRQADPDLLRILRKEAATVPGVLGVEKLLVRKTGLEYLVDIHIEVDPEITVREGHTIAHRVKDHLLARVVTVKDVLVHVEPAPRGCPTSLTTKWS
jgi:cation diffusion facilitator family transporter